MKNTNKKEIKKKKGKYEISVKQFFPIVFFIILAVALTGIFTKFLQKKAQHFNAGMNFVHNNYLSISI